MNERRRYERERRVGYREPGPPRFRGARTLLILLGAWAIGLTAAVAWLLSR